MHLHMWMHYDARVAHNQKLDAYPLAPGCDFFTRSVRTPCIDTGVDVDENIPLGTRIYVSQDTVGEWARMFGWISPDEAAVLKSSALASHTLAEDAAAELARLRHVIDALRSAGFTIPEPEDVPEPEITEFPHHKGGGWWLFSDGTTDRCTADEAAKVEAEIAGTVAA